jgi:hypothetical protein
LVGATSTAPAESPARPGASASTDPGDSAAGASSAPAASPGGDSAGSTTPRTAITASADRSAAAVNELIALSGEVRPAPPAGTVLQVERSLDGGPWEAFPVTIEVRLDGSYRVFVRTGMEGVNRFRLAGTLDGQRVTSPPAAVPIG